MSGMRTTRKFDLFDLDTAVGRRVNAFVSALIIASMVGLVAEIHYRAAGGAVPGWIRVAEGAILAVFCCEYVLRAAMAQRAVKYMISFYGVIDLLTIIGGLSVMPVLSGMRSLRLLRVFRVMKLVRGSDAIARFKTALRDIADEMAVYLSASGILMFIASIGIYELEHDQEGTLYSGIFDSFYWAVLSLTAGAEGYAPMSAGGKMLSIVVVVIGLGVVAVPSGLLASALYKADADMAAGRDDTTVPDVG